MQAPLSIEVVFGPVRRRSGLLSIAIESEQQDGEWQQVILQAIHDRSTLEEGLI
jgi:hypothetical protein